MYPRYGDVRDQVIFRTRIWVDPSIQHLHRVQQQMRPFQPRIPDWCRWSGGVRQTRPVQSHVHHDVASQIFFHQMLKHGLKDFKLLNAKMALLACNSRIVIAYALVLLRAKASDDEILSELLPHVRVDHVLPPSHENLAQANRRGLVSTDSTPPSSTWSMVTTAISPPSPFFITSRPHLPSISVNMQQQQQPGTKVCHN